MKNKYLRALRNIIGFPVALYLFIPKLMAALTMWIISDDSLKEVLKEMFKK
jgi:hypothetical protein